MRCGSDVDLFVDACLSGARGNLTAAYLGAYDVFEGRTRESVCGRLARLASDCPLCSSDDEATGRGFVWLDGSRRVRHAV